jgi:hypothetical protein
MLKQWHTAKMEKILISFLKRKPNLDKKVAPIKK